MKKKRVQTDRGLSRKLRNQSRPVLERFEDRVLMAVFTVTNTTDSLAATAGDGSLRGEILASNASTSSLPNEINFVLPNGQTTISPVAPLPTISEPVTVDGSSVNGSTTDTPIVEILGSQSTSGAGFTIDAGEVVIQELSIGGFAGDAIDITGPGNDNVSGSYIGLAPNGSTLIPNSGTGILIEAPGNFIGTSGATGGIGNTNVISGNNQGIEISGATATGNTIANNFIGTDATGKLARGNTNYGIVVNSSNNTIGGNTTGNIASQGNLISGNLAGIEISTASARHNLVAGNYIGTDITGLKPIPNTHDGLDIINSSNNSIGGLVGSLANVISGNGQNGIEISGNSSILNVVYGNDIGVGSDKITAVGNSNSGVIVSGASENIIGGTNGSGYSPTYTNIIANNGIGSTSFYGVEIIGGNQDGILSNSIYNNGGLGIKLNQANAGALPPTLSMAESGAGKTKISGSYAGVPNEPYLIQFFSSQTENASGAGDGKTYLGDLSITTNANGTATFTTTLNQAVPVGAYVSSTATDHAGVVDNTSQFSTNVQDTQAPVTDLSVSITAPSTPPLFDQNYTYTVTVTNNGPNDDTGVVLTDTLPTTATFVSSSGGTAVGGTLTDDIGDIAHGGVVSVTITVKPNTIDGVLQNTAFVTGDGLDPNLVNNDATTTATIASDSDLAVLITPESTSAPVGSPFTYTISVSNFGPNVATGAITTFGLPSDWTDVTVTPDQGTYTIDGNNNITINTGLLGVSQTSTITVTGTPQDTGVISVTAAVTSSLADPNTSNNSVTDSSVTVANAADLGVTLASNVSSALTGDEFLYTVTVTNNGPSAASEPQVLDPLPTGLTYVAADSSAGGDGTLSFDNGTVTANLNALLAGGTDTITIAVVPTGSGPITNTVTVGDPTLANSVEIDTDPDNNSASLTTVVSPADLSVNIINPTDPLFIGTQAVYQIQVTNLGTATATNVVLADQLGNDATIVSASGGDSSTVTGNSVSFNAASLASGATDTFFITVNPTVSGTLLDNASVSADQYDPDSSNNTATSSNLVSPVDVGVTVTPSESSILLGQPLTFFITVTNYGPATATNVDFIDSIPAGTTLDSSTSSQGALISQGTGLLTANLGSLASGASASITITVTPTTVESATNTASATPAEFDTNESNNSVTTTVNAFNLPGTIQFNTDLAAVPENAGSVTLTVDRTGGSLGAVSVDYATSDYTGIAGVNYIASSGTVSFADGQTTATITIPVLNDGVILGPTTGFFVTLSNPTGGASLGTGSVSGVLVTNTDFDTIPPDVTSLIAIPNGKSLNGFIVTFDKVMNLSTIADLSNYKVYSVATNGAETPVPIVGVQYNLASNAVTLVPPAPIPGNHFYRIILNGSTGDALTDISGNRLAGSTGAGTNYNVVYGQGTTLTYDDALNNSVSIKISNGGNIGIFLNPNGNAEAVNLYGIIPGKTKLTGSVKKLSKHASGYTEIGFINGFGQFGDVYSTLTTPSFYVGSAPVGISSLSAASDNNTVNALSISTSTVSKTITSKSKTPKGPKVKLA